MLNNVCPLKNVLTQLRDGKMIIIVDDAHRENEGDLVMAAEMVSADDINFMALHGRGLICLPMSEAVMHRLELPMMMERNRHHHQTAFSVSIDAANGTTTGISAADRALTARIAANPQSRTVDISTPGHMFPLRARSGGVFERPGHTEASVDLMKMAGLQPVAVICEIMNLDGTMARTTDLKEFAKTHQLSIISVQDIIDYRVRQREILEPVSTAQIPIESLGMFTIHVFRNHETGVEHVALMKPSASSTKPCLVRVHSACLTGDVFGSQRCDCGWQLNRALEQIHREGGILLYLAQEGRGIGLANKIKAYALQEQGLDTVEANEHLGFRADERDYHYAAQMLKSFQISQVRLMTNNPDKVEQLRRHGIDVCERTPLETKPSRHNIQYLNAKREKLGHTLTLLEVNHAD